MKEQTEASFEKSWASTFNNLPLHMKIKSKDVNNSMIQCVNEVCGNLSYLLSCVSDNPDATFDLDTDDFFVDWFSDLRKMVLKFKSGVRDHYENMESRYCKERDIGCVKELFGHKKSKFIKGRFGFEDERDARMKIEDVLRTVYASSFKPDLLPDDRSCDFKTSISVLEGELVTFEKWFKVKSEIIKNHLKLSVKDMTKYLELDNLVKEKNEVLNRLSHLPISVRGSIPNSILLSEKQFNMLNNFELQKKVIVTNAMITKIEVGIEDGSIYVGGVGTFIMKYSEETRKMILASEKSRLY